MVHRQSDLNLNIFCWSRDGIHLFSLLMATVYTKNKRCALPVPVKFHWSLSLSQTLFGTLKNFVLLRRKQPFFNFIKTLRLFPDSVSIITDWFLSRLVSSSDRNLSFAAIFFGVYLHLPAVYGRVLYRFFLKYISLNIKSIFWCIFNKQMSHK